MISPLSVLYLISEIGVRSLILTFVQLLEESTVSNKQKSEVRREELGVRRQERGVRSQN
jgi:hypothetical protein